MNGTDELNLEQLTSNVKTAEDALPANSHNLTQVPPKTREVYLIDQFEKSDSIWYDFVWHHTKQTSEI